MIPNLTRKRRPRTVGLEIRGSGPEALLAATVLQAVADLQHTGAGDLQKDAREWLLSSGCEYVLEQLDIPYEAFLEALEERRLRRGTSTRAFWEDDSHAAA